MPLKMISLVPLVMLPPLMVTAVLLGPLFWRLAINDIDFTARLTTPSFKHPLGTDDLGRDLLARVLYGGRISLAVGMAAMLIAITVGVLIGAIDPDPRVVGHQLRRHAAHKGERADMCADPIG